MQTVSRDRQALALLHHLAQEAELRLMESSYQLGSLVHDHYVGFGGAFVPEFFGVPEDVRDTYNELLLRETAQQSVLYSDRAEVVQGANRRFAPVEVSDEALERWKEEIAETVAYNRSLALTPPQSPNAGQFDIGDFDLDAPPAPAPQDQAGPSSFPGAMDTST